MNKLLLFMLLCLSYTTYCQPKDIEGSILEKIFSQELNIKNKITQEKDGIRRDLTPFNPGNKSDFFKYLLTEVNSKGEVNGTLYLVSKKGIEPGYDLFNIKINTTTKVVYFDKLYLNTENIKDKQQGKIIVKIEGNEYDMNEQFAKIIVKCEEGTEICVDHWWVTYNEETGEILEIDHIGSDCYPCNTFGGGSGYSGTTPTTCDPVAVYPEEKEFNDYTKSQSIAASNQAPPSSNEQVDPVVGSITWTVAEGAVGGWRVEAVTSYSYLHDRFYNSNLNAFEDIYDFLSYKTSEPYFTGSNFSITTTYTNTVTTDQVFKNKTSRAYGKTIVNGRIQHVLKIAIRIPFCGPLNLDFTENIGNELTFLPK